MLSKVAKIVMVLLLLIMCSTCISNVKEEKTKTLEKRVQEVIENVGDLEKAFFAEKNLVGQEHHLYKVRLGKQEIVDINVSGAQLNAVVSILGLDGKEVVNSDNSKSFYGKETVSFLANTEGIYSILIKSVYGVPSNGKYKIDIKKTVFANSEQVKLCSADFLFYRGKEEKKKTTELATKHSIELFEEALVIYDNLQSEKRNWVLLQLGRSYSSLGQSSKAIEKFEYVVGSSEQEQKAFALNLLGLAFYDRGETQKALEILNQALPLLRIIEDKETEADTLSSIGSTYWLMLSPEKARDYYYEALIIWEKLGLNEDLGLHNLATVCDDLGQYDTAEKYYRKALEIIKENGDKESELITTIMFARNRSFVGKTDISESLYKRCLELVDIVGNVRIKGILLSELANMHVSLGNIASAKYLYEQTLVLVERSDDKKAEAIANIGLGKVYSLLGKDDEGLEYLTKGLKVIREVGEQLIEMDGLYGMALIYAKEGKVRESLEVTKNILSILESIRSRLYTFKSKTAYFASVRDYYGLYIDNLFKLKENNIVEKTFVASEKARARAFAESLNQINVEVDKQLEPKLKEQHRELLSLLSSKLEQRLDVTKTGSKSKNSLRLVDAEIDQISEKLERVEKVITKSNLQYGTLKYFSGINLKETQRLIDKDTVLVEYFLGRNYSYVWLISNTFAEVYQLAKEEEISAIAVNIQSLINARVKKEKFETPEEKAKRIKLADTQLEDELQSLSDLILRPIMEKIKGKRLLVVADGALNYIPFAALKDPTDKSKRLLVDHEVVNIQSMTVFSVLEKQKSYSVSQEQVMTIFADPVFNSSDTRLTNKEASKELLALKDGHTRKIEDLSGFDRYSDDRLIHSRKEAEYLLRILPSSQIKAFLDFSADLGNLRSEGTARSKIVHMATHGLFSEEHPELSGLMLSRFDEKGDTQNGFISASEIYSLKLQAELVVLSACQTGLGKNIKGEGVVGLTRGFMFAGAKKVIVSLWNVNDKATSELMTIFYQKYLLEHKTAGQALREAQLGLIKSPEWENPYYWAAFTMYGNYK